MVKILFINIVKEVGELTNDRKDNSRKAKKKHQKKMDRNTAFYRGTGRVENFEFQKIGLNEFGRIKAEAKRRNVIKGKNHKVTYADHIVSGLAAASPEDVCHRVKNKQDAGNDLEQNERPPAVVFQRMPG